MQFAYAQPDRTFKKSDLVEHMDGEYFINADHHVGQMLGRMVKAKQLRRIVGKRGYYKLISMQLSGKTEVVAENQGKLFDL